MQKFIRDASSKGLISSAHDVSEGGLIVAIAESCVIGNIGAALIGYLVEVISLQPFNEYCNQHIFEPLDMDSRWFLSELNVV